MDNIGINKKSLNKITNEWTKKQNKDFEDCNGKIIYRPHGGGSVFDSLNKAKEFNSTIKMKEYIVKEWNDNFSVDDVVILAESHDDDRIGWKDVRHVCIKRLQDEDYIKKYSIPQCIGYCSFDYNKIV